jgi:hypothetical protein
MRSFSNRLLGASDHVDTNCSCKSKSKTLDDLIKLSPVTSLMFSVNKLERFATG